MSENKIDNQEIDIFDIFMSTVKLLVSKKLLIFSITTFFAFFGIIYNYVEEPTYTIKQEITSINPDEEMEYKHFNMFLQNEKMKLENEGLLPGFKHIDRITFLELAEQYLMDKDIFLIGFKEAHYLEDSKYLENDNIDYFLSIQNNINILLTQNLQKNILNNNNNTIINANNSIIIEAKNIAHPEKFIESSKISLNHMNESIRNFVLNNFNKYTNVLLELREYNKLDLVTEIKNLKEDYELEKKVTISKLRESALIAREIDLPVHDTNVYKNLDFFSGNGVDLNEPHYLMGYVPLEEAIELIESRDDAFYMDFPGMKTQEYRLRNINQDKSIERLIMLFNKTPLFNKDNFVAFHYNKESISIEQEQNELMLLFILILIGFAVSCFGVVVSNAYRNYE